MIHHANQQENIRSSLLLAGKLKHLSLAVSVEQFSPESLRFIPPSLSREDSILSLPHSRQTRNELLFRGTALCPVCVQ